VDIAWSHLLIALVINLVPAALGLWLRNRVTWKLRGRFLYEWVEKAASGLGAAFLAVALAYGIAAYHKTMLALPAGVWLAAAAMEPLGAAFGYAAARGARLAPFHARAIALETGVQNATLTLAMVALSFKGEERDRVLIFPLLYSLWYVINSAWLVVLFRHSAARDDGASIREHSARRPAELADDDPGKTYGGPSTGSGLVVVSQESKIDLIVSDDAEDKKACEDDDCAC
jgi:predicted Na+-dependent transporter